MTELGIFTSAPTEKGSPINGDSRNYKGEVWGNEGSPLQHEWWSRHQCVLYHDTQYDGVYWLNLHNSSDLKRCLDWMKKISLPKPKHDMGEDGVAPLQDLVDAKIVEYQIREYVNWLINTKNGLKAEYSLIWGHCSKATRSKYQSLPIFEQVRDDYNFITKGKLI